MQALPAAMQGIDIRHLLGTCYRLCNFCSNI